MAISSQTRFTGKIAEYELPELTIRADLFFSHRWLRITPN